MKRQIVFLLVVVCLSLGIFAFSAEANIVIKVRALNPLENKEIAAIRYPLPEEIVPNDIIRKNIKYSLPPEEGQEERKTDFNVEFIEEEGRYFIVDEVQLGPKEVVTLEAHVNDIWMISNEQINGIRQTVEELTAQYFLEENETSEEDQEEDSEEDQEIEEEQDETITLLEEEIYKQLDEIKALQAKSSVLKVGVEKHMEAYYENVDLLGQVQADVEMLRYMIQPEEEEAAEEEEEEAQEVDSTKEDATEEAEEGKESEEALEEKGEEESLETIEQLEEIVIPIGPGSGDSAVDDELPEPEIDGNQ